MDRAASLCTSILLLIVTAAIRPAKAAGPADIAPGEPVRFAFARVVANVETVAVGLQSAPPATVLRAPAPDGIVRYGSIMRRIPGERSRDSGHYVPFMVEYEGGVVSRAWFDSNFDGDLTGDPPVRLSAYPAIAGARSFLTDLRWTARVASTEVPIDWKLRIVVEPLPSSDIPPIYHVQMVYAMMGDVAVDGKTHKAFLFDGNGDGLYTMDESARDGVYVDMDDDLRFYVSEHSPEFGAFSRSIQLGPRLYDVVSVDPEGRELSLRKGAVADWARPPGIGGPAPAFSFKDGAGREVRLDDYRGRWVAVYFWGSWCRTCAIQADAIKQLHDAFKTAGLEILGVSFDTDRAAMEKFRKEHGHTWPTSFSGTQGREDPIGRLYWAYGAGLVYLVDREGRLEGIYEDLDRLAERLRNLIPQSATGSL